MTWLLIIDDDLSVRQSFFRYLTDMEFEVVAVSSAEEGLALLAHHDDRHLQPVLQHRAHQPVPVARQRLQARLVDRAGDLVERELLDLHGTPRGRSDEDRVVASLSVARPLAPPKGVSVPQSPCFPHALSQ